MSRTPKTASPAAPSRPANDAFASRSQRDCDRDDDGPSFLEAHPVLTTVATIAGGAAMWDATKAAGRFASRRFFGKATETGVQQAASSAVSSFFSVFGK